MKKIEYRMYGFVPYNISEIQKGIQFGHAVVEYALKHGKDKDFLDWAKNDKTFIILNGGTTNSNVGGGMQENLKFLQTHKIKHATFVEPDLNFALSGIVFLVEERVFNKEKYADILPMAHNFEKKAWAEWIGKQNVALREFLKTKRLA